MLRRQRKQRRERSERHHVEIREKERAADWQLLEHIVNATDSLKQHVPPPRFRRGEIGVRQIRLNREFYFSARVWVAHPHAHPSQPALQ